MADKNKECRKLKRAIELKDGQIASLEEARKKDEGKDSLSSSHPTTCKLSFCFDKQLSRQLYFFVELLDTTQEILRNNTDMQSCMNEAADLVALVAKLKEDHFKELEQQDLKHAGEMSKLTDQISNLSASLETVMKTSKEQHVSCCQDGGEETCQSC